MISVDEALELIRTNVPTMATERLELAQLHGRILAEPIHSPIDLPIFTNSAVDGYALRSEDTGPSAELVVAGEIAAGDASTIETQPRTAVRVFTGAPIPRGTDAVIMQEDVSLLDTKHKEGARSTTHLICLTSKVRAGAHIRKQGEELRKGERILDPGTLVTPAVLGVLASLGLPHAVVYSRPRAAIIGTGNELVAPGSDLQSGQIFESNTFAISAAAAAAGAEIEGVYHLKDDRAAAEQALADALATSDAVITCGGVSVGQHDLVRAAAANVGISEVFWRVAMRPGKPFFFGLGPEGQPVFGLPGNPVSALVTFYVLVLPALRKMSGLPFDAQKIRARLATSIRKEKGRADFIRGRLSDGVVEPLDRQGSHMGTGLADSNCLICTPADTDCLQIGDRVEVMPLSWGLGCA